MVNLIEYSKDLAQIREFLIRSHSINESTTIGLVNGYQSGIAEALIGLGQIFRQKKRVILIGGASYLQKYLQNLLASLSFDTKTVSWTALDEFQRVIDDWDPGVVLCPREHIVTTEPILPGVRKRVAGKRMGLISWSHYLGLDSNTNLSPYEVQFTPMLDGLVFCQSGLRYEFSPAVTDYTSFPLKIDQESRSYDFFPGLSQVRPRSLTELSIHLDRIKQEFGFTPLDGVHTDQVTHHVAGFGDSDLLAASFKAGQTEFKLVSLCQLGLRPLDVAWIEPKYFERSQSSDLILIPIPRI